MKPGDELIFSSSETIDETLWDTGVGSSDVVRPDMQVSQSCEISTQCT